MKFYMGKLLPEVQTLSLLHGIFDRRVNYRKWYPFDIPTVHLFSVDLFEIFERSF